MIISLTLFPLYYMYVIFVFFCILLLFVRIFCVTVDKIPTSFSPFSLVDCMLLSHFSFNDFITLAFPDLAGDLDV